jgi:hypothetical protein
LHILSQSLCNIQCLASQKRSFVSEERRRVLSQGRQIEHQAGKGGYLAQTTRRAGALAAFAGILARQRGASFALALGKGISDELKLC